MAASIWLDGGPERIHPLSRQLAYTCGAGVLASLFVLKFMGPPPRAFRFRAALVVLMLANVGYAHAMSVISVVPVVLNLALGLILMSWYARE